MLTIQAAKARAMDPSSRDQRFPAITLLPFLPESPAGWAILVVIGLTVVAGVLWLRRTQRQGRHGRTVAAPPLIFPAAPASAEKTRTRPPPPLVPFASSPPPFPVPAIAGDPMSGASPRVNGGDRAVATVPEATVRVAGTTEGEPGRAALFEGQTIKFHVPHDGTLQLLPGRLELVAGPDSGQVIRFVRGEEDSDVTFGRSDGPPYRHVQLRVPTVSRRHARMHLEGTQWCIGNLSVTNPLLVNGEEITSETPARPLHDGDRIEMGELVFVYRER